MKKIVLLLSLILVNPVFCGATQNIVSRWKSKNVELTLRDIYGTTLNEYIRASNQRDKAYHIFNLLNHAGVDMKLNILLSAPDVSTEKEEGVHSLDIDKVDQLVPIDIKNKEEYNPFFDHGRLLYLQWKDNVLSLEAGGISIYRSARAFDFMGKRGENIIIRVDGKLNYLSEAAWVPVETLKDFTVDSMKWLDDNNFVAYAERDSDGRKFIVVSSVRKPESEFMPAPEGKYIDVIFSRDKRQVYAVYFEKGVWKIYGYIKQEKRWQLKEISARRIYPLGIRSNKISWWDPEISKIVISDGTVIGDIYPIVLKMYPRGEYIYGETDDSLRPVDPYKKIVLLYGHKAQENLAKAGFKKIEKFDSNPQIWLLSENFRSSFTSLPDNMGHVHISLEKMKLFYDFQKKSLRKIRSVKLRPSIPKEYILIFLGIILVVLLINDLMKKAREFTR